MSTHLGLSPTAPTSAVRSMVGREKELTQGNLNGPATDAALREYCDKHYNQLLPILAEKMHQEKVQQEKLKFMKARLNFEEVSQHSESGTPSRRKDLRKRLGSRRICGVSESPELKRGQSESPRKRDPKRITAFKRLEKGVFHMLGDKGKRRKQCQKVKVVEEDAGNQGQKTKYQALRMAIYPSHGYARKLIRGKKSGTMGNANMVPHVQFHTHWICLEKCIKDPGEIHHIKQREGESTEDFVRTFKIESRDVKGEPKFMRISGFMHGITNPELIKCLHDKILRSVDEMMRITTSFLRGRWQLVTKSGRSHFHCGNKRSPDISKNSKKEVSRISKDVFSWNPTDMTGVPRHIEKHWLNVREGFPPVRQKKRGQATDINHAIQEKVKKLVDAGIMKEVHYQSWLSNPGRRRDDPRIQSQYQRNKVCPDKIDVVLSLSSLKCLKDMQKLNGKPASLNRFLAKSAEKSLPFFKTLKRCTKKSNFYWTEEAESAF
nr:reverse transcriptase domain-containing protein [Tanacetum cinerariifolium]